MTIATANCCSIMMNTRMVSLNPMWTSNIFFYSFLDNQ